MSNKSKDYQDWKDAVLEGGRYAPDSVLYHLFEQRYTPEQAIEAITEAGGWRQAHGNALPRRGRPFRVLDLEEAQRFVARAIADECLRLSARKLTPEAKAWLIVRKDEADKIAFGD